jgi:chemosensory pili system protein ChpA (sensor histidine kinase/response regulator)
LTALIRSFGVIKGSGLVVGARRVVDVLEVVEDILSPYVAVPVRDPRVTSFIAAVLDQLPALVRAESPDRGWTAEALIARARQLIGEVSDPGSDLAAASALVPLVGEDAAAEIPIEDLLDLFEPEPESAEVWILPAGAPAASGSHADSTATRMVQEGSGAASDQALAAELERAFSADAEPQGAADAMREPTGLLSARVPEMPPLERLIDGVAEMGRCCAELGVAHAHWLAGLDALDQGLGHLRALMDLVSIERLEDPATAVSAGGPSESAGLEPSVEWPELSGRVVEILDELESVRAGLAADRDASDAPRIRLGRLLETASDLLLEAQLMPFDAAESPVPNAPT